jgi:hypothetical protein
MLCTAALSVNLSREMPIVDFGPYIGEFRLYTALAADDTATRRPSTRLLGGPLALLQSGK